MTPFTSTTRPAALQPQYLRPKAAAQRLGMSVSWLWGAVAAGRLPKPRKLSSRVALFDVVELDAAFTHLLSRSSDEAAA